FNASANSCSDRLRVIASSLTPGKAEPRAILCTTHLFISGNSAMIRQKFQKHMSINLLTRRKFIQTTTVAAAAAPLAGKWARAAEPDKKLGFALVGLGNLSTNQIAPALQKTKYCRLAGIVTGTPAKAEKWKAQYKIPEANIYNYDTMEKMADNPDIDVVYV